MEKSIYEEMGGTYSKAGNYNLSNLTLHEETVPHIGIWGQRPKRYLKQYHKIRYYNLLTGGALNGYLAYVNEQAEARFSRLVR